MQFVDPVCKKKLRKKEEYAIIRYRDNVYHLCCKTCKEAFDRNPLQYISEKSKLTQRKEVNR